MIPQAETSIVIIPTVECKAIKVRIYAEFTEANRSIPTLNRQKYFGQQKQHVNLHFRKTIAKLEVQRSQK
jgi:hypothetical protein